MKVAGGGSGEAIRVGEGAAELGVRRARPAGPVGEKHARHKHPLQLTSRTGLKVGPLRRVSWSGLGTRTAPPPKFPSLLPPIPNLFAPNATAFGAPAAAAVRVDAHVAPGATAADPAARSVAGSTAGATAAATETGVGGVTCASGAAAGLGPGGGGGSTGFTRTPPPPNDTMPSSSGPSGLGIAATTAPLVAAVAAVAAVVAAAADVCPARSLNCTVASPSLRRRGAAAASSIAIVTSLPMVVSSSCTVAVFSSLPGDTTNTGPGPAVASSANLIPRQKRGGGTRTHAHSQDGFCVGANASANNNERDCCR
jgi:hypothetical protein